MTEEQKDNLEKMAKGKLNLLECRAVAESILADEIFNRIQQQVSVEPVVKPESGELSLETMTDNLPQNRILYKDSGLWMIIDEEDFNTTDKMLFQVARYQQTTKETFAQFIKRCFDNENGYYIKNY